MKLTEAQRKTIATLESMSNEAADQLVAEPQPFGSSGGTSLRVMQSVWVEVCTGWATHEIAIHPDGSTEVVEERLA